MLKKLKTLIKNMLAIKWFRKSYEFINRLILEFFASNRVFATFYSILGLLTFNREQYAVLRARRNYYRNYNKDRSNSVELRRNIHRLEKGMIMQPRRSIFARDYIGETIDYYEKFSTSYNKNKSIMDETELQWAHDVLGRYFSLVDTNDKVIGSAYVKYQETLGGYACKTKEIKVPHPHKDGQKSDISYDEMLKLALQRRSVRWFRKKSVPRKLLDQALMVGRQSPSACNRLPYKFRVFDDPKLVKKIASIPFGATGYSHQIPTIIVVTGELDYYFSPRDRHIIYIDASLAAMSFMFALETLGLSSSVINWPDFEPLEIKMQKALGLDASERVVMLIAVGFADPNGGVPYSQKKNLDSIRTYNELPKK